MSIRFRAILFVATLCGITLSVFADDDQRKYPAVEIFINNHRYGEKNGCSSQLEVTGGPFTCGHAGHVSEVAWEFLRSTSKGDIYKVSRKYPSDSDNPNTDTKEETYSGKPLTLWHDDYQKIILRPVGKDEK